MSPTLSDDLLVRDLHERVERALPPMGLDPADVLLTSRRHRRRQTALRSVGGFAVAAVAAVGALQLADGPTETAPADPDAVQIDETLSIRMARDVEVIETDVGPAADLGLTVYDLDFADPTQALRYVVARAEFDGGPGIDVRVLDADGSSESQGAAGPLGTQSDPRNPMLAVGGTGDQDFQVLGVVPAGLEGATFELVVAHDAGDARIPLSTFTVPGLDGDFFFFLLHDERVPFEVWPTVYVELTAPDGTTSQWGLDGQELEASGADTLAIEVAQDAQEVETDGGTAVDLGIPVPTDRDPLGQGLTYSLRAGLLVDGDPGTPDVTGLWLDSLGPDGTTKTIVGSGGGGTVDEALTPTNRDPTWMSMLGDHEACMVGVRPPALEGATFDLIIERDTGKQVVPIPTFRVPGLDADVWFVALIDPDVDIRDWPPTSIRVTDPDGTTTSWSLAGVAQTTS